MIKLLSISVIAIFAIAPSFADITYPFSVTTVSLNANDNIRFLIGASGIFYVDCGSDGVLTSDTNDISGPTNNSYMITRTNTNQATYTCTYSTGGAKTLRFGGRATGYNTSETVAAIRFNLSGNDSAYWTYQDTNAALISSISGDLSLIFPYLGSSSGQQPRFYQTFRGCTGLTEIPEDLFANITIGASNMFYQTFQGCTGVTSIPGKLFSRVTTGATQMFRGTFIYVPLTRLPDNLFSGVTTGAAEMFRDTFEHCTSLTGYIPPTLFAGLIANGSPKPQTFMHYMFYNTGLSTSCPTGTTQYITRYESYWHSRVSCVKTVSVTYSCGTGTGTAPASTTATEASSFTPATNTCTKSGYNFNGWLVSGTNDVKTAGTAFTWNYAENKTLTAQWTGNTINTIWYNEGTQLTGNNIPGTCTYGALITPPIPASKAGYQFTGWRLIPGH